MFKRLLPTRIRKRNKESALHEPNRVPSRSRQATDHQSRPHSPARVEDSNAGPATMAATRPKRVRTSLIVDWMCCDQHIISTSGCDIFQSATASVVPRLCMQGPIRHYSVNRLPRLLTPSVQTKVLLMVDKVLQFRRNRPSASFSTDCRPRQKSSRPIRRIK